MNKFEKHYTRLNFKRRRRLKVDQEFNRRLNIIFQSNVNKPNVQDEVEE